MNFSEIIGNESLKARLIAGASDGRVSHAQLFAGQSGGGNLGLALAYATFIHCKNRDKSDSCGKCVSCIKHNKLIHPDLHFSYPVAAVKDVKKPKSSDFLEHWRTSVLENPYLNYEEWMTILGVENKQGLIPVEESNDILKKLSLKSFESKYKIQIIWLPEKMAAPASNKLLKIIEEPPDNTLFILVSENTDLLLPTILSRTQHIKVRLVEENVLMKHLAESNDIKLISARRIAHLCSGNISKAFRMAQTQDDSYGHEQRFIQWMRLLLKPVENFIEITEWVDDFATIGRENQKAFIHLAQETVRECLVSNHGDHSLGRFDNDVIQNFDKFSRFIHSENAPRIMELFDNAHYSIERNANPKILFIDLSLKISRLLKIQINENTLG